MQAVNTNIAIMWLPHIPVVADGFAGGVLSVRCSMLLNANKTGTFRKTFGRLIQANFVLFRSSPRLIGML